MSDSEIDETEKCEFTDIKDMMEIEKVHVMTGKMEKAMDKILEKPAKPKRTAQRKPKNTVEINNIPIKFMKTPKSPRRAPEKEPDDIKEMKNIGKDIIFDVSSKIIRTEDKQKKFKEKMKKSKILNQYVDNRCGWVLNYLNEDFRAGLCYTALYFESIQDK